MVFSSIPVFTCTNTSWKSMFHKSVKRNKDTICKEKTKASQEQIIYLKKGTSIIQAPSPVIINVVTSKKPQHWFLFGTQNRKLTSGVAASPGAITPHQSLSQSSLQHCVPGLTGPSVDKKTEPRKDLMAGWEHTDGRPRTKIHTRFQERGNRMDFLK